MSKNPKLQIEVDYFYNEENHEGWHIVHYCGQRIGKNLEKYCQTWSVHVEDFCESSHKILKFFGGDPKTHFLHGKSLEQIKVRYHKISINIARLVKEKLIPEEIRDSVEIVDKTKHSN